MDIVFLNGIYASQFRGNYDDWKMVSKNVSSG